MHLDTELLANRPKNICTYILKKCAKLRWPSDYCCVHRLTFSTVGFEKHASRVKILKYCKFSSLKLKHFAAARLCWLNISLIGHF